MVHAGDIAQNNSSAKPYFAALTISVLKQVGRIERAVVASRTTERKNVRPGAYPPIGANSARTCFSSCARVHSTSDSASSENR